MSLILLAVMFIVLWAIVILPQQRRVRAHQQVVGSLQEGDEVMTTSGILGTITALDDELIHLEVAPGTQLRIVRGAIARRMVEPEPGEEPDLEAAADDEPDVEDAAGEDDAVDEAVVGPSDGEPSGPTE